MKKLHRNSLVTKKLIRISAMFIQLVCVLMVSPPALASVVCTVGVSFAVDDLCTANARPRSIDLTWTTPDIKTVSSANFDIRYSKFFIDSESWDVATQVAGEPQPFPGENQSMKVQNLNTETTYYFALKITGLEGQDSAISNIATGVTPPNAITPMAEFELDSARIEFKTTFGRDKADLAGEIKPDLRTGDGVDISELVTVSVGTISETVRMEISDKKAEQWLYRRPHSYQGIIQEMDINWKRGSFEIKVDNADLSGLINPLTLSLQVGDDIGIDTVYLREKPNCWELKRNWWNWNFWPFS